jgi:excisionase family DNA binding protein
MQNVYSDDLLTKIEVAARMKVTPRTVDSWMKKKIIPFRKIGRAVRFDWSEVLDYLKARNQPVAVPEKAQPKCGIADLLQQRAEEIRRQRKQGTALTET